jgi:hypothetical protein
MDRPGLGAHAGLVVQQRPMAKRVEPARLAGIKHCAAVEKVSSGCVNRITNKKLNKNAKSASEYGDNAVALNRLTAQ